MDSKTLREIVERLRKQGTDDAQVEVKACATGLSSDIWESVSAFGNTHGGTIVLGLEENNDFAPVAGFSLERVRDQFVSGFEGGKQHEKIRNAPQYAIKRVDFEDAQVLVIEISEVETRFKPCYIAARGLANGSYKRVDDKDLKLSPTEIYEMQHMLEVSPADRETVEEASVADLDEDLTNSFLAGEKERGSKALKGVKTRSDQLRRLNVVDGKGSLRLAGLLALGQYPQQFFPKLVIDVAVHPGIEKSEPDKPRFVDRVICEGPLGEMIDDALSAVARNLRTLSHVEGVQRHDELEIPREVLREAIANAVIHREYDRFFIGQSVSVDIYSDRVEITNPGGLWGGKTLDNIADGQSRCRNSALMKIMSAVRLRHGGGSPAEGQGSGVPLMIREMRSHALDAPRFEAKVDYFKVVLSRGGIELSDNRAWFNRMFDRPLDKIEEAVLAEARRQKEVSVKRLHAKLGYDSDDIRETLRRLMDEGVLDETKTDVYALVGGDDAPHVSVREAILQQLSPVEPKSARELAEATGKNLASLRAQMAKLVDEGIVQATAPSTSPNRRYTLTKDTQEQTEAI